ncbi:syntaxin-8 [Venturia canescens]|uniref:syntaxin-8 n=1 Tax=Venturia canescens TaxID=32260 RepID=UPI001C9D4968|nr:syntaxin-8 [Venturia canescens]
MALVPIEDSWLVEHDACEKLFRDVMELLTQRDRSSKNTQLYASLSADMRFKTKQYTSQIEQLKNQVETDIKQGAITSDEGERRTRQVERLQSNLIQLRQRQSLHTSLNSSAFADAGTTSWGIEEDDDDDVAPLDIQVSIADLKAQNRTALEEQEQGLDELYKVITRQKEIAQTIESEVNNQNEIIDDLADHMDRTDERLIDGTRRVRTITRSDSTCGYWIVILLLFIIIIIVALV